MHQRIEFVSVLDAAELSVKVVLSFTEIGNLLEPGSGSLPPKAVSELCYRGRGSRSCRQENWRNVPSRRDLLLAIQEGPRRVAKLAPCSVLTSNLELLRARQVGQI